MMLAFTIAKVYQTCKLVLSEDSQASEMSNSSKEKKPKLCENSSKKLDSIDIFNINRRLASDTYFQKRKKCSHVYFTFIPKVKTQLRIS